MSEPLCVHAIAELFHRVLMAAEHRTGLSDELREQAAFAIEELVRPPSAEEVESMRVMFRQDELVKRRMAQNFDADGKYVGPPKHGMN